MPCWHHEGTLSVARHLEATSWFLCDDCRRALRGGRRLQGALAESPSKVESRGPAGHLAAGATLTPPSPPPGARPERDPAFDDDLGSFSDLVGSLA